MTPPNTPTGAPQATRPRPARLAAAAATVLTALGVLAAPALTPSSSTADTLTFPYDNGFTSAAGGTLSGDAVIRDGRLRLTDAVLRQAGAWSTDDTFPSDRGLEIEFEYAMWNDIGDTGADGLLLSLADGAAPQGVGSFGAGLGYACRYEAGEGSDAPCDLPGLPGGFAAVALDRYGNFSLPLNGSGPGASAQSVVIRGSGDGLTGYRHVAGIVAPAGVETKGPRTRTVRVTLQPGGPGELFLTVKLEAGDGLRPVLDHVPLHGDGQAPLPATLRLGFAGATGSHVNAHEIDALRVWQPADLAVAHDMPATVRAGSAVEYAVTARNTGDNASAPSPFAVDVPNALQDVTWTCSGAEGTTCADGSGTGDVATTLDLPQGGTATVVVRGTLPAGASGTLDSRATIATAPELGDVHEDDNVSTASAAIDQEPAPAAHVETDKSVAPSTGVVPGDAVEYTVTARNVGPAVAQDVGAVDDLPAALRFVGSDDGCTASGQRVTCSSGTALAAGESTAFRIRAQLDPTYAGDGSDVVNVATATSPTDPDGGRPSPEVGIGVVPGGGPGGGADSDGPGDESGSDDSSSDASGSDTSASDASGDVSSGSDASGNTASGGGSSGNGSSGSDRADGALGGSGRDRPRAGALAYTGVEGLGLLAGASGAAVAVGAVCWWSARRRRSTPGAGEQPVVDPAPSDQFPRAAARIP